MKNTQSLCLIAVSLLLGLSACAVNNSDEKEKIETDELIFANNPEDIDGKIDVYTSMARAVKYNVDLASQNLNKKIFNSNPNQKPHDIIKNVMNNQISNENPLYNASRVLEFSIIYAVSNLSNNLNYVENNFYIKSSQHLAMAAIRSHQDTLFATKKIKEINRLMLAESRELKKINDKMERMGNLDAQDLEYKKGLEVALLKLGELRKTLDFSVLEYGQLVKIENKMVNLEGRRFYELEDFDKNYSLEIFQEAAVRNRREFALAKELMKSYTFNEVKSNASNSYPEIEYLDINGLDVRNELYAKKLVENANLIANNLIDVVLQYRKLPDNDKNKQMARGKVFDQLGIAIITQVEVNFKIVQLTNADFQNVDGQIVNLKKEIKSQGNAARMSDEQKVKLLDDKVKLIELEMKRSQITGERAVALRSLYFDSGFSPFSKQILKGKIKDIVGVLKAGFNHDVVQMLSAATKKDPDENVLNTNDWAKRDNWLEVLVDGKPGAENVAAKPMDEGIGIGNFSPYEVEADKLNIMQLGSFVEKRNANSEWERLLKLYPELANYKPSLERSRQDNKLLYRLVVTSTQGGYRNICNKLRADKVECLLK